jgi:hypothetical protein
MQFRAIFVPGAGRHWPSRRLPPKPRGAARPGSGGGSEAKSNLIILLEKSAQTGNRRADKGICAGFLRNAAQWLGSDSGK